MSGRRATGALGLLLLSITSLLLAFGSAYALLAESGPYLFAGSGLAQRIEVLADGEFHPGLSRPAHDLILDDCVAVASSLYGLTMPTERRNAALKTCSSAATGFAAASPTYAYAYYVVALLAAEHSDSGAFNAALGTSRELAPTEQWLAELRVKLSEDHLAQLQPAAIAGHETDLALLVISQRGIRVIARRYAALAGFRERITAIVETLPPEQQRRFVAALRNEIAARRAAPPATP
ncbi:hypothetical protein VW23_004165 [Devosia insulae DS-56]|uniref:Uncharacterized protein n=1 Tax=Devosia insulae DS-56 TaxID=1116389 RepID=A0A1E5XJ69_9HYPH|nr:hypothetical protein [Devosia insulae]OEO28640.1 hypothetical protein VW23_004165 [Devosia insulae DS-56]